MLLAPIQGTLRSIPRPSPGMEFRWCSPLLFPLVSSIPIPLVPWPLYLGCGHFAITAGDVIACSIKAGLSPAILAKMSRSAVLFATRACAASFRAFISSPCPEVG
eukprot:g54079.t1